ncbi:unnamed protein product [Protopolystoma xenopodis]|uniref:Uncharacterized protein n=1 Tax=Protopolystoma xenopodis TaxID=117903 RepID=A0A3S5A5Q7_9PLAT|nr:unnamed protein product [Protopolystoma xenopodis]
MASPALISGSIRGRFDQSEQITPSPLGTYRLPGNVWDVEENALQTQHERHPLVVVCSRSHHHKHTSIHIPVYTDKCINAQQQIHRHRHKSHRGWPTLTQHWQQQSRTTRPSASEIGSSSQVDYADLASRHSADRPLLRQPLLWAYTPCLSSN